MIAGVYRMWMGSNLDSLDSLYSRKPHTHIHTLGQSGVTNPAMMDVLGLREEAGVPPHRGVLGLGFKPRDEMRVLSATPPCSLTIN